MIEDVTTALQAFASTGNGFTLTLRDARFLTFKVQGNGNVTAGAVTLECCPQNTPIAPGSGSAFARWNQSLRQSPSLPLITESECFQGVDLEPNKPAAEQARVAARNPRYAKQIADETERGTVFSPPGISPLIIDGDLHCSSSSTPALARMFT